MNTFELKGTLSYSEYTVFEGVRKNMLSVLSEYNIDDFKSIGGRWNKEDSYSLNFLVETLIDKVGDGKNVSMKITFKKKTSNISVDVIFKGKLTLKADPLDATINEQIYVGDVDIVSLLNKALSTDSIEFKSMLISWDDSKNVRN